MNENTTNTGTNAEGTATENQTPNTDAAGASSQDAKKFSQEEVNSIIKERLERAKKDLPSKEEMDAFRKWQDSQKTAEQLSAEKITAAESARTDAERRAEAAEAKVSALSKGVAPDAVDDVIALAMNKVSDSVTLGAAIDAVIEKYPAFASGGKLTTGAKIGGGNGPSLSGVEAAFYAKNPDLLPKH